ncbi:RagB/SusD family nutrient uptake outer membrane protein [Niabella ginsengisoli]|uniref:RagB/SusD family nutrient uptake outer membrane protein n=1 Tax=Niabella ginsengisoli TaxID=522298 RepID=A0ABS9SKS1_9BACT|nr:RagB/SusD family nutrient uptake outer membrane protein [Niabella ginsengisoli]MCH5598937.1 RagB/SusD family nutrient uptake outer membrane protein [Niabella ginsengisoli]
MSQMAPISKRGELSSQNPTQELVDCYLTMNGLPVKGAEIDPSYVENNPYVNRDPRLTATIVYDNYKWLNKDGTTSTIRTAKGSGTDDAYISAVDRQTKTGYYVRKYYDWDMVAMAAGLNIIMFRYADVLLMYAEACNELSKITQQEWDMSIRPIRSRAGFEAALALNYPAAKNQEEIRQIIRNERRVELALEGLRWFDIKRWQIGEQVLKGFMHGFKFGEQMPA